MFFKGLLIVLLVSAVFAYEKEGNVLVLHDADFPQVLKDHDFIMIEFYAPWYILAYLGVDIARNLLQFGLKLLINCKVKAPQVILFFYLSQVGQG